MASKIAIILALTSIALAHPRKHHHHTGGYGTGTGGGFAQPTGIVPFPANGTDGMGAGSPTGATGSVPVISVTVQPLPESTPVEAASAGFSSAPDFGNVAASSGLPVEAASSDATCSQSTTTTTMTTVNYVTVTAEADSSQTGPAGGFGGSSPSASSSGFVETAPSASTSVADYSMPSISDLAPSATGVEASSISLTSTISVSAGEFYGGHSYSYGGGYGQSSSAAASVVPTTFATAPSGTIPSASVSYPAMGSASASMSIPAAGSSGGYGASSAALPTASSTTPTTGGGSSSGKKGLSYNTASLLSAFSGDGMSWAYNWGSGADGTIPSGIEYVPMCWGLSSVNSWAAAAAKAIAAGSKHVLSFNEPDLGAQSNIDPATAAKNHITYLNPLSGSAQIGSPAITNGAGTSPLMGIDWLNSFFDKCGGQCKVDFVAFHWYDSASNLAYFKSHVQDVINAAAKQGISKVWLTEFGASGSDSEVASFISEATAFLDSTAAVERYAYFMASDGILLSGSGLSTLGKAYAG